MSVDEKIINTFLYIENQMREREGAEPLTREEYLEQLREDNGG